MPGPEGDDDEISRYALRQFHELIAEAPGTAAPVLILMPDEAVPAQELVRFLPPPVLLAPVGREIMLRHLRLVYEDGGHVDAAAVLDALPPDQALAGLSTIALNVTLRAPDAVAATKRLAEVLEPPAAREDGPSLEDIAGDGEALVAARQLVADLALWQHGKLVWNDLCRSLLLYGRPGPGKIGWPAPWATAPPR